MQIADFEVGKQYLAKKADFLPPDGSPAVPGEMIQFTVLEQADATNTSVFDGTAASAPTTVELASWADFLRVQNHSKAGKVHLLHPSTLEQAALVE